MNRYILILPIILFANCKPVSSLYVSKLNKKSSQRDPNHSNIYIQKVSNKSSQGAFVAVEHTFVLPLNDRLDLSGHLMPGTDFQLKDFEETPYSFAVPIWKNSFRGDTFNVITLSGNPGRIYFLYVIKGHLWAVKAPDKEGEMKGIHLLDPADHDRTFELTILNNNSLSITPIVEHKKRCTQQCIAKKINQGQPTPNKTAPQAFASQQKATAPQSVQNRHRTLRHQLPASTHAKLRNATPD